VEGGEAEQGGEEHSAGDLQSHEAVGNFLNGNIMKDLSMVKK
jgi:hypothetical protein